VRPNAAQFDSSDYSWIISFDVALLFSKIGCVDYIFAYHHAAHGVFRTKAYSLMPSQFEKGHWRIMSRDIVAQTGS
jgi:hypothetical protein